MIIKYLCGIGVLIGVLNLDICVIMKQYRNMCYVVIFKQRHSYFTTSTERISLVKGGMLLEKETGMMTVRLHVFQFFHQIPSTEQNDILSCGTCLAKLLIQ